MKARYIHEELGFERTGDVKKGLSLGKRERIHQWFREWAPYADYEIGDDLSIYVKEDLDLENSQVTHLPKNLIIDGDLYLSGSLSTGRTFRPRISKVTKLPENLSVKGNLWIGKSPINYIPKELSVEGVIYIKKGKNIEVPDNLKHKIRYI